LFLTPELWEAHKVISSFHSDVLKALGSHQGIPRNDMMAHFLEEDALEYWRPLGGFPVDQKDWDKKVAIAAANLAQHVKTREAERLRGDPTTEDLIELISKFPPEK